MIKVTMEFGSVAAMLSFFNSTSSPGTIAAAGGGGGGAAGAPFGMAGDGTVTVTVGAGSDDEDNAPPATIQPGELDSKGFPWDERIHAASKNKIGDGSWRKKKGVDQNLVTAVEAEFRARQPATPAAPVAAAPLAPAAPVVAASPVPPTSPAPAAIPAAPASIPAAPAAPVSPATPSPAPTGAVPRVAQPVGGLNFGQLMQEISWAMTSQPQKLSDARLAQLCGLFGVSQITEIAADQEKLAQAYNWLLQEGLLV